MARALLFFFVSPVWPAWWLALALAAAEVQGEEDCSPKLCGKVIISFPFGLVPAQAEKTTCGSFGFQVRCTNNTPYLGYYQDIFQFQILDIFYGNGSLLVADSHKLDDFNNSSHEACHVPTANTSSKVVSPFSISPVNQNLIFYNCTEAAAAEAAVRGLVKTKCHNNTFVRAEGHHNETSDYDAYSLEACDATVVPVLGASGKVNASDYEKLISDGFLLTWQPPAGSGKLARQIN